jgi:hypothetical protein
MAKDDCVVTVYNCTIVDNSWGFTNYSKINPGGTSGGGHTIAWNNILWGNDITVSLWNAGTLAAWYNDFSNTNWPGDGNINVDPMFANPAERDYRLDYRSPIIYAGTNGTPIGAQFPVGGLHPEPLLLMAITNGGGQARLVWLDIIPTGGFIFEASSNFVDWSVVGSASKGSLEAFVPISSGLNFRMKATNFIGASLPSKIVSATGTDSDTDGMPDFWENIYGFDPGDPRDGTQDADSDGQPNYSEFRAGTDPRNAASRLDFASIVPVGNDGVRLSFTAQAGKAYLIQYRDSLGMGDWWDLNNVPVEPITRLYSFTDTLPPGTRTRFYRAILLGVP